MYKNKKVAVACLALVLVVLVSVVFQALPPPNTQSGRVYRYEAFIRTYKEPEDDPWGTDISTLSPDNGSEYPMNLQLWGASSYTISMTPYIHPTLDILTSVTISVTFSVTSTITTEISLRNYMYIPARTYVPGIQYRWRITVPGFVSENLFITPIPVPETATRFHSRLPMSAECSYWSGGQLIYSTSGLSISKTETRFNSTHYLDIWVINFDSSWIGRSVSTCMIFTASSGVISSVNTLLQQSNQRTITSGRLYLVILSGLNIVVESGDRVEVWAYYVTTPNL